MVVVAFGADLLAPYSFTAFDLKARLAAAGRVRRQLAPIRWAPTSSAATCFSRLIMSIRISLLIAFFGTLIAATLGTALGFVAAHFRRLRRDG